MKRKGGKNICPGEKTRNFPRDVGSKNTSVLFACYNENSPCLPLKRSRNVPRTRYHVCVYAVSGFQGNNKLCPITSTSPISRGIRPRSPRFIWTGNSISNFYIIFIFLSIFIFYYCILYHIIDKRKKMGKRRNRDAKRNEGRRDESFFSFLC